MNSYRLLRSNKESGPFTQEQLIAMGFKPYDLIWVEGKSAGWRYPSEIPEFKTHSPMVEEQPFDRFFKKPVVPAGGTPLPVYEITAPAQEAEAVQTAYAPSPAYSPAASTAGRHIHVTLPSGGGTLPVNKSVQPVQQEKKSSFSEAIAARPMMTPVPETLPAIKTTVNGRDRDWDAAREENIPAAAGKPATGGFSWTMIMGLVVGIFTLVGLGIMIGMNLNQGRQETAKVRSNPPKPQQAAMVVPTPVVTAPVNSKPVNPPATGIRTRTETAAPAAGKSLTTVAMTSAAHTGKESTGKAKEKRPAAGRTIEKPATGLPADRAAAVMPPAPRHADAAPGASLEKQVNIHTNDYKVGAFGGIYNLQCTLVNDSRYLLESVDVELQYIQANEKVFKTEKLSFRDVAAGAQVTLSAPTSSRGVKIISRVVKINPREPGLASIVTKS